MQSNVGMPLADSGFASSSFEYGESAPTDRSVQHRAATALIGFGIVEKSNEARNEQMLPQINTLVIPHVAKLACLVKGDSVAGYLGAGQVTRNAPRSSPTANPVA